MTIMRKPDELKTTDYSDSTPDISFKYDRMGRHTEITDALGIRTLTYNDSLQPDTPDTEKITGMYNRKIIRKYDTVNNSTKGRPTGFSMGADYNISYGYDTAGRLTGFGWKAGTSRKQRHTTVFPTRTALKCWRSDQE